MSNPVQRTPYVAAVPVTPPTALAYPSVDELANPNRFGTISNAVVNGLSPAQIGTLIVTDIARQPYHPTT